MSTYRQQYRPTQESKSICTFVTFALTFGVAGFDESIPNGPTLAGTDFELSNCCVFPTEEEDEEAGMEAKSTQTN